MTEGVGRDREGFSEHRHGSGLDPQLAAEFHHAVGGKLEEVHRVFGDLEHPCEEVFAPQGHAGHGAGGDELLPAEEVAGVERLECRAGLRGGGGEIARDVDVFHEAVV